MGWNEPGNGKDPWGRSSGQRPPDLDELLKKFRNRFGGGGGGDGISAIAVVVVIIAIWLLSGFYIVEPAERGVVLRFGQHVTTTQEGLHWRLPFPIDRVEKVNVEEFRSSDDHVIMLTQDENIVDLKLTVQYRAGDAKKFLFNVRDPELSLQEATRSAVREVVGRSKIDDVIKEGREKIGQQTRQILQDMLDAYDSGIFVTSLTLQSAAPPDAVKPAFDDVTRADEDEDRKKNEAEAYANTILPQARGEAARLIQEAEGHKSRVTERARGDADRFLAMVAEYEKAPQVMRKRLYLDSMESVLGNSSKVLIDSSKGGNQMIYLPLDQLMRRSQGEAATPLPSNTPEGSTAPSATDGYRSRERAR
jgi:membrane protease subunit HflK